MNNQLTERIFNERKKLLKKNKQEFMFKSDFYHDYNLGDNSIVKINLMNITGIGEKELRTKNLWEIKYKIFDNLYDKKAPEFHELINIMNEYSILDCLLNHLKNLCFKKTEKPDFILKEFDDKKIGLEITSTKSELYLRQIDDIVRMTFGRNKTPEEIKDYIKNHKKFKKKYYTPVNGIPAFSYPMISAETECLNINSTIIEKIKKSENYVKYDKNWLAININDSTNFKENDLIQTLEKTLDIKNDSFFSKIYLANSNLIEIDVREGSVKKIVM